MSGAGRVVSWRIVGEHPAGKLIGYYLDDVRQCTFIGMFDGMNRFDLRFHSREWWGEVPKTRVIYLSDIKK